MDDERLKALILEHRRGRDAFDALAISVVQLYLRGELLPDLAPGEEHPLEERLAALTVADVERALAGDLGAVPLTRSEYEELLTDILSFVKAWLATNQK